MTQKQLNRYKVISMTIEGKITTREAAESLGLSERQIIRLKKGVMSPAGKHTKNSSIKRNCITVYGVYLSFC